MYPSKDGLSDAARQEAQTCAEVLRAGGVIVYPTDTIWGLGCDATNAQAVEKIFQIKKRPGSKSLITLVKDLAQLDDYVETLPENLKEILQATSRPQTIIYPDSKNLAPNVMATDGSAGIRIVADTFCKEIINIFQKPIVSTSANIAGEPFSGNFGDIPAAIIRQADYVVRYRQKQKVHGAASRVIRIRPDKKIDILRE